MQVNIKNGNIYFKQNNNVINKITSVDNNLEFNNSRLTNIQNPINDYDAVTKKYIENLLNVNIPYRLVDLVSSGNINNLTYKDNVLVYTEKTCLIINGVKITNTSTGMRILIKDQNDKIQNGIYQVLISNCALKFIRTMDRIYNGLLIFSINDKSYWEYISDSNKYIKYIYPVNNTNLNKFEKIYNLNNNIILNLSNDDTQNFLTIGGKNPSIIASGQDTNIDLNILSKGDGNIILNGIKYPKIDGLPGQILTTDGHGNLVFKNNIDIPSDVSSNIKITTNNNIPTIVSTYKLNITEVINLSVSLLFKNTKTQCGLIKIELVLKNENNEIKQVGITENRIIDEELLKARFIYSCTNNIITTLITGINNMTLDWTINTKITIL